MDSFWTSLKDDCPVLFLLSCCRAFLLSVILEDHHVTMYLMLYRAIDTQYVAPARIVVSGKYHPEHTCVCGETMYTYMHILLYRVT